MTVEVINFQWHIPQILATGGKPSYQEQFEWLKKNGFGAIVSCEGIPKTIVQSIAEAKINHLFIDLSHEDVIDFDPRLIKPEIWQKFSEFVRANMAEGKTVFVHCSAGIKRSVMMVRRFLHEQKTAPQ